MSKYVVMATWKDVPHLSEEAKQELLASIPPYQRRARTEGVPQLGSGAIYPLDEIEITVEPFQIPPYWPKCYALDVGWNRTATLWGAWDRETDTVYLYSEYYRGEEKPIEHAATIRTRGKWMCGVIDPTARNRKQDDGNALLQKYLEEGLNVIPANNTVEAGIYEVWERFSTGRLKVFKTLQHFFEEFRLYRRDEKGKIVKKGDHLMDCLRYLIMSGLQVAKTDPSMDYDTLLAKVGVEEDGYRRAIRGILDSRDSDNSIAHSYH